MDWMQKTFPQAVPTYPPFWSFKVSPLRSIRASRLIESSNTRSDVRCTLGSRITSTTTLSSP
jgi:hypothetical protein